MVKGRRFFPFFLWRPQTDTPQIACVGRSIDLVLLGVETPQL
jgi:hypothetical protein